MRLFEIERARLEDQLRQSEKLRAIGQLAGGIAHDFNNQLTGILGHAELLRHNVVDPQDIKAASAIIQAGKRAAELTQQLLAYARKGRHRNVPTDLHAVIEEAVSILERSLDKRIRIVRALRAKRHVVTGDPTQLQNAVLNLALNARDAMPDGGDLQLATSVVDDEDVVLGVVSVMLGRLGYRVTCCRSGQDGVARFREAPDDYDLVLLDLIMPIMGGRETFKSLREIRPEVRVVIFTGFSTEGEAQQLLDAGAVALVQKPFRYAELSRALAEALAG